MNLKKIENIDTLAQEWLDLNAEMKALEARKEELRVKIEANQGQGLIYKVSATRSVRAKLRDLTPERIADALEMGLVEIKYQPTKEGKTKSWVCDKVEDSRATVRVVTLK